MPPGYRAIAQAGLSPPHPNSGCWQSTSCLRLPPSGWRDWANSTYMLGSNGETPNAGCLAPTAQRSSPWPLVAVVAVFLLSRVGYYVAGVRFDASSLPWFWQYIDPVLLKTDLGQSLWYLHSQPPAFNLFLGIVLNLFPGSAPLAAACPSSRFRKELNDGI